MYLNWLKTLNTGFLLIGLIYDNYPSFSRFSLIRINHDQMSLVVRKRPLGFTTRSDSNQALQAHKMARGLKFWI